MVGLDSPMINIITSIYKLELPISNHINLNWALLDVFKTNFYDDSHKFSEI